MQDLGKNRIVSGSRIGRLIDDPVCTLCPKPFCLDTILSEYHFALELKAGILIDCVHCPVTGTCVMKLQVLCFLGIFPHGLFT